MQIRYTATSRDVSALLRYNLRHSRQLWIKLGSVALFPATANALLAQANRGQITRSDVMPRLVFGVLAVLALLMLARGLEAMGEAPTGERYSVAGRSVSCGHCQHDHFVEGRAQLNTAGMTFLNLDWANRSAATLTCTACGRIEWFLADPEEIG